MKLHYRGRLTRFPPCADLQLLSMMLYRWPRLFFPMLSSSFAHKQRLPFLQYRHIAIVESFTL